MEGEKASISVDIDKQLLLKFKSICVLKEVTMSEEVEKMVGNWVSREESQSAQAAEEQPPSPAASEVPTTQGAVQDTSSQEVPKV